MQSVTEYLLVFHYDDGLKKSRPFWVSEGMAMNSVVLHGMVEVLDTRQAPGPRMPVDL